MLACGVRDILGARVVETPNHHAIFGLHQQIGRDVSDRLDSTLDLISVSLKHAAWRHIGRLSPGIDRLHESLGGVLVEGSRFYFHVDNGRRYPDETGSVFSTRDDATAHAFVLARELAEDGSWLGFSILVTDGRGQEITRVAIGR